MRKPSQQKSGKLTDFPRVITIVSIVICVLLVLTNVVLLVFFSDEAIAKRKLEEMAREYYEEYAYEKWTTEALAGRAEQGMKPISLRVLLSYDAARNAENETYFDQVACDATKTYVIFYPEEPYGRNDYRMEINYSCNFD